MNSKELLIEEIKQLNIKFDELSKSNTDIIVLINKEIMKRDIEDYINRNSVCFRLTKHSDYEILGNNLFEEIIIHDFGFQINSKANSIYSAFDIELNNYGVYSNNVKVGNEIKPLGTDYWFMQKEIYFLDNDEITNIINEYKKIIYSLEKDIKFLEENRNINNYSYKYSLYNKTFAPEVFFKDIDEIIDYIKN